MEKYYFKNLNGLDKKKVVRDIHEIGDIIFVKKEKNNLGI